MPALSQWRLPNRQDPQGRPRRSPQSPRSSRTTVASACSAGSRRTRTPAPGSCTVRWAATRDPARIGIRNALGARLGQPQLRGASPAWIRWGRSCVNGAGEAGCPSDRDRLVSLGAGSVASLVYCSKGENVEIKPLSAAARWSVDNSDL